ncbi:hypothetical protein FA13DRAFT_735435 [Coprinellus micaceus]|uniref:F-box domain-containing protein n=1 Tax=Coprinellus micaceus TaxID=71717 RepID=A0A4Y7TVT8_COPMI|nr:hypothetical protein FA13DRAFT_735435 [Coprinellus micaceus]
MVSPVVLERRPLTSPVLHRVEPIIYRDVIVDPQGRFHRTVTAPHSTKPPKFFATHVKCLLFNGITITSHIPDILEKCHAVQSLALWVSTEFPTPRLQALLTSRLLAAVQRISVSHFVFGPGQGTFSLPILRDITHLNVLWPEEDSPWEWGSLVGLSSLTHLEVDIYFSIKSPIWLAEALVGHCPPTVRVLIMGILLDGSESGDTVKEIAAIDRGEVDFRVVLCGFDEAVGERLTEPHNVISMAGAVDDWGRPSTTPYTIWDQAMEVVERRLALRSTGGD